MHTRLVLKGLVALGVATAFTAGFLAPASTEADEEDDDDRRRFTERSIKGAWGWTGAGTFISPVDGEALPSVGLGTTVFDGVGGCTVTSTVNIAGTIVGPVESDACTYSVNADGTGTSTAMFTDPPLAGEAEVSFVVVDKRREIRFIQHNEFVVTFIAKRL